MARTHAILKQAFECAALRIFVDSTWPHAFWACHHLPERSFFIRGRQFHVCARCTGLIVGLPASLLLLPFASTVAPVFAVFALGLLVDGTTQLLGWRTSTNGLRFITGLGTSSTLLPTIGAFLA